MLTFTKLVKGETVCTPSNPTTCLPLRCFVIRQQPVEDGQCSRRDWTARLIWSDYKHGFGNLNGEFWLGLDKIHRLTSDNNSMLHVDLEDFEENTRYAEYSMFGVMSENEKYKLILGSYSGNLIQ